jgi:hypothetical protein
MYRRGGVASLRRWLDICAGGVRSLGTWPRAILAQACQQLALGLYDDADDASPGLTLATRSWFPTTLLLAVAVPARAGSRPPVGGGYVVPGASYKAVTGDARPGRILLAEQQVLSVCSAESNTATSATSCRTRTIRISCRCRLLDLHAARNQNGGPGQLQPLVRLQLRRDWVIELEVRE